VASAHTASQSVVSQNLKLNQLILAQVLVYGAGTGEHAEYTEETDEYGSVKN